MKVIELWQCVGWGMAVATPTAIAYLAGAETVTSEGKQGGGIFFISIILQVTLAVACYKAGAH